MSSAKNEEDKLTLEQAFEQLEGTIEKLSSEDISLEESFQVYQEGMRMLKYCNETIDMVEKKVMVLDEDGTLHEF